MDGVVELRSGVMCCSFGEDCVGCEIYEVFQSPFNVLFGVNPNRAKPLIGREDGNILVCFYLV